MYRIIQWATGNVGHHALRMIVERPDFELIGLRVYDPAKRGRDAGDLLGTGPVGVRATVRDNCPSDPELSIFACEKNTCSLA